MRGAAVKTFTNHIASLEQIPHLFIAPGNLLEAGTSEGLSPLHRVAIFAPRFAQIRIAEKLISRESRSMQGMEAETPLSISQQESETIR